MGLFSRPTAAQIVNPSTEQQNQQVDVSSIVNQVVAQLRPFVEQRQSVVAESPPTAETTDDIDPDERSRMTRVAGEVTSAMTGPYAQMFNMTLPVYARDRVVNGLTEGQKIIYERHKQEVDQSVDAACANSPALKAAPQIHENAVAMVLGKYSHEIEDLVLSRLTADQLPATFAIPRTTGGEVDNGVAATDKEKEWVAFFAPRSRNRDWDVETERKFRNIKPGFLHEMVAQYKEMQKAEVK